MSIVTVPRRSAPVGSLAASSTITTDDEILSGVEWAADPCPSGQLIGLCSTDVPVGGTIGSRQAQAAAVVESVECGAVASATGLQEIAATAVNTLNQSYGAAVEELLLTGGPDAGTDDTYLQGPGVTNLTSTAGTLDVVPALSLIVETADTALRGARALIHVPRFTVPYLTFYGLVTRFQGVLQLANTDHQIVAGAGYDGTGPAGVDPDAGTAWIYATGQTHIVQTGVMVPGAAISGGVVDGRPETFLDRATNVTTVRAQRAAAVAFDDCLHVALQMCVPNPGPGCA